MANEMMSPFQIRNLAHSNQTLAEPETLVRISGPGYDKVITANPAAKLRYKDEENDTIILGSSRELSDKLEEPVQQSSRNPSQKSKNRMSIAMLLSEAEQNPQSLSHHVFDIEEREEIKKLWQEIQRRNKTPSPSPTNANTKYPPTSIDNGLFIRKEENCKESEELSQNVGDHIEDWKKDKLAVIYGQLREPFWSLIASEVGVSWKQAENLHWALGQLDMDRRAKTAQIDPSSDVRFVSRPNGNSPKNQESKPTPSSEGVSVRQVEDYRMHHFNTTKPPRMQSYKHYSPIPYVGPKRLNSVKSSLRPSDLSPKANLTVEGRRQAQAAGDILRSRTMPSRHRKATMTLNDHAAHQNRWADYKSSDTPFSPKAVPTAAQDIGKPSLTLEGKRQAQAAGDKLRSRTNPIRHSRPCRSGSSERGIHKNRWSSYVASRAARLDVHPKTDTERHAEPHMKAMAAKEVAEQPSLLEVFEAELARDPSAGQDEVVNTQFPDPEISTIPQDHTDPGKGASEKSAPSTEAATSEKPVNFFSVIKDISNHLQSNAERPRDLEQFLENGVSAAVGGLDTLVQGITDGLQELSNQTPSVTSRAREADPQNISTPFKEIQDLIHGFTSKLSSAESEGKSAAGQACPVTSNTRSMDCKNPVVGPSPASLAHSEQATMDAEQSVLAVQSENEGDTVAAHVERPPSPLTGKGLDEKTVYYFRHKLQRALLVSDKSPKEDEMKSLSEIITKLESCSSLESSIIHSTKIHKVFKAMIKLPTIPLDETYHFKSRSVGLLAKFRDILSCDDPIGSPAGAKDVKDISTAEISESQKQASPRHLSECIAQNQPRNRDTSPDMNDNIEAPRFHEPGPIHLPHHASLSRSTSVLASSSLENVTKDVDALHRSQAIKSIRDAEENQIPTPIPTATRFPTLAQFESGQGFASHPSFPALPTMEPLKPQLAVGQPLEQTHREKLQLYGYAPNQEALQDYEIQLALLEKQNKKRLQLARQEQSPPPKHLKPSTAFFSEGTHRPKGETAADGESQLSNAPQNVEYMPHSGYPGSAARLAEPFDPLEAEPTAQPHLTEGVRRNATVSGTDRRHNAPRRRPYSEAYDGRGRVAWNAFVGGSLSDEHDETLKLRSKKPVEVRKSRDLPKRSETVKQSTRFNDMLPMVAGNDMVGSKFDQCVEKLQELGYGNDNDGFGDRLLIYAQAADGNLEEAIEMIDEEQRVYAEMF